MRTWSRSLSFVALAVTASGKADPTTADAWAYASGVTRVVEMTNAGTILAARFPATNP